ncbi:hypothetical protein CFP56_034903 [Quercus suber]|uniref:Uncharacterized protein n=1 Tax=Quercus suber TaxID=58331 RepID=A0AAW0JCX2_QUESU
MGDGASMLQSLEALFLWQAELHASCVIMQFHQLASCTCCTVVLPYVTKSYWLILVDFVVAFVELARHKHNDHVPSSFKGSVVHIPFKFKWIWSPTIH